MNVEADHDDLRAELAERQRLRGSSRQEKSGLWGLKEISQMNMAKAKRKESSGQNRRHQERRKADRPG